MREVHEEDARDASDRPAEVTADAPEVSGFELCPEVDDATVRRDLRERLAPEERDPRHLRSIRYEDRVRPGDAEGTVVLGVTRFGRDPFTDRPVTPETVIYDHGDDATHDGVRHTVFHEVGHVEWRRAPEPLRDAWRREVHGWAREHPATRQERLPDGEPLLTRSVNPQVDDADVEEHFCEAFGAALVTPERLADLDADVPEEHRRDVWIRRFREAVIAEARKEPGRDA